MLHKNHKLKLSIWLLTTKQKKQTNYTYEQSKIRNQHKNKATIKLQLSLEIKLVFSVGTET